MPTTAGALTTSRCPERERFLGTESSTPTEAYYGVLLHELTQWTGYEGRCQRQFGKCFGDNAYVIEEMVAELGAAILSADLRIARVLRADHAAYIDSWLQVLKTDKKAIFTAASQASKTVEILAAYLRANVQNTQPNEAAA